MNKKGKTLLALLATALVSGGAYWKLKKDQPLPVPPPPQDKLIHVYDGANKELATVDLDAKKVEMKDGAKCEDAVVATLNYARQVTAYHEQFKRDVLNTKAVDALKPKEEKAKK